MGHTDIGRITNLSGILISGRSKDSRAMERLKKTILLAFLIATSVIVSAQKETDWRYIGNGDFLHKDGYVDQPYVVKLENGKWLCVFTTGIGEEGDRGQHIVCKTSADYGKTWSQGIRIEEPAKESSSWAMPYLTKYGRVYVFYNYNGEKVHTFPGQKKEIRDDTYGWFCYKYSDDEGKTWSKRYRLPVRTVNVDLHNNWKGKVQIQWGVGEPVDVDGGMMLGFSKIGWYIMSNSEGWFFKCTNINHQKDPELLDWIMLPEGEEGLQNESYSTIHEEHNLVQMNNGTLYSVNRTEAGTPMESYSYDRGRTFTLPMPIKYHTGSIIKHPRANVRVWKCKNGKYILWHHNNGNWWWKDRNPGWLSGGKEVDGKIVWTQPEIAVYDDVVKTIISYPDLIEQDGRYWITETQKSVGRSHEIPAEFMDMLWKQFDISELAKKGLVLNMHGKDLKENKEIELPKIENFSDDDGFTIDLITSGKAVKNLPEGTMLLDNRDSITGKGISVSYGEFFNVVFTMCDGEKTVTYKTDPGLLSPYKNNRITLIVDNGPRIIRSVVNEIACDGGKFRDYGWNFFDKALGDVNSGKATHSRIVALKFYDRPLYNTEAIGNHRMLLD